MDFTKHLDKMMVLDSPLSLERRGVILYDYCMEHYRDMVPEVSVAWIEAGLSLKKQPAGEITKIKNLESFLADGKCEMSIVYGNADHSHRYYLLSTDAGDWLFGYDSQQHITQPVFKASIIIGLK